MKRIDRSLIQIKSDCVNYLNFDLPFVFDLST